MLAITYDVATGKEIFRALCKNEKGYLWPIGATHEGNEIIVYGEYFNYKDKQKQKINYKKKIGFYIQVFDEAGNLKRENFSVWEKDVAQFIHVNSEFKMDNNASVIIHKFINTSDGKSYAIAEQYKKNPSLGIGMLIGTATAKFSIYNMMVFEFGNDMKLSDARIFEKPKSNIILPRGFGILSSAALGYYGKSAGWFDYVFTTQPADKSTFGSVYVCHNKNEYSNKNCTVGAIALNKEQQLVNTKVDLMTTPTEFFALPAKPGYIAVFEYFEKTLTGNFHLEKLDL